LAGLRVVRAKRDAPGVAAGPVENVVLHVPRAVQDLASAGRPVKLHPLPGIYGAFDAMMDAPFTEFKIKVM